MTAPDLAPFPSVKKAVIELLQDLADGCSTATPDGWNGESSFLRIRVLGGASIDVHTDAPIVDVDALTGDEITSDDLAELVRQRFAAAAGRRVGDFIFDTARCVTRPHSVPWGVNAAVFNTTATYRVSQRRSA